MTDYRRNYDFPLLPELITGARPARDTGWPRKRCVYFDVIEMLDHYVRLVDEVVKA